MSKDETAFAKVLSVLHARLGVDLALYKSATLRRRMDRRVAFLKLKSLDEYLLCLRKSDDEVKSLFNDLLIPITGFFRDQSVFTLLKEKYLLRLLTEKGGENIRIWVPACSTGEEVYSLAILFAELFAEKKIPVRLQIFGTDVNELALDKARVGFYPEELKKQISPERRVKFFDKVQGGYQIRKNIRDLCIFAKHNVIADPPFSNLDLISCRNLLIYLTPQLQHKLMPVFHYALRPQGILLLGSAETVGSFVESFALEDKKAKIYTKKNGGKKPRMNDAKFHPLAMHFRSPVGIHPSPVRSQGLKENKLKSLVSKAVKDNIATGDVARIIPLNLPQTSDKVYLVFVDPKMAHRNGRKSTNALEPVKDENAGLKKELFATRASLQSITEQGEAINEELRAANEEVITSNEELQSTNEELETAKEELLSNNEELAALNRELQNRNLQLERAAAVTQQFAAIVESSDDAIISKSLDSIIITWNKGAEKIFGYTAEEIIGKPVTVLIPEDHIDEEPAILARLRSGEPLNHYETVRRCKDGRLIDISLTVSPIRNAAGIVIGASKIARDITEKKRAESNLKHARDEAEKANRIKDEFLAALSHELRTPLNPVLLVASDAAADHELPPGVRASFDLVRRNVEIEARLIDDLLDLTRITSGKLNLEKRNIFIHEVLKNTIAMLRSEIEQKQLALKEKHNGPQGVIFGDSIRLQQVFWNVLKNAIKFTPPKGTITVETRTSNEEFELLVSDTGVGMTKQELECAFDAFRQGHSAESQRFGGLGLGLTIGKRLLDLHAGNISAASHGRNYGSTFTIKLPVVNWEDNTSIAVKTPVAERQLSKPGYRILLVEDHNPTRDTLAKLLIRRHHHVTTADSISAALACAGANDFDVIVSDIGLPDGNGNDLFLTLRANKPHLEGIALTGFGMEEDINRSKKVGFKIHLTKPVSIEALEAALLQLG